MEINKQEKRSLYKRKRKGRIKSLIPLRELETDTTNTTKRFL